MSQERGEQCFPEPLELADFVQFDEVRFRSGLLETTAWRIHPDGRLEFASWDDNGNLTGLAQADGAGLFETARRLPTGPGPDEGGPLGRPAHTLTVSGLDDGRAYAHFTTEIPQPTSRFLEDLHERTAGAAPPEAGEYLVSSPAGAGEGAWFDLDAPGACADPALRAMARMIRRQSLVHPLGEESGVKEGLPPPGQTFRVRGGGNAYLVTRVRTEQ